jgi:hypothetical protein
MEEFELEPGETVTTEVRQHVFVLLLRLVPFALLAFVPLIILPVFSTILSISQQTQTDLDLGSTGWFFLSIWWLFLWMGAFAVITRYFLTVWVITSHRIVDISQSAFFSRRVSSFLLVRVQDVTTDVSGVLGTLIGFGDINVETAGSAEKFAMCGIRHPESVRDLIMGEVAALHRADEVKTGV